MFPAVTSSCEVTYLDEMPFEMSDEYFDAGVNVAEKFGVIVVNGDLTLIKSTYCFDDNYYLRTKP
jgi:hypothetical protein